MFSLMCQSVLAVQNVGCISAYFCGRHKSYLRLWFRSSFNVVEQANILDFSKLDNIGTPLRLFELLFDDALVDTIVGYIKLYDHREKVDTSFEITNETFL